MSSHAERGRGAGELAVVALDAHCRRGGRQGAGLCGLALKREQWVVWVLLDGTRWLIWGGAGLARAWGEESVARLWKPAKLLM